MILETALESSARRFARAYIALHVDADRSAMLVAALELDAATHDLIVAAGEDCPYCDGETCPGLVGGLPHEVELVVRPVEDTAPL